MKRTYIIAALAVAVLLTAGMIRRAAALEAGGGDAAAVGVWGPVESGLQIRLRAPKTQWRVGEPVVLQVDVRNQGKQTFEQSRIPFFTEVEVDGAWHIYGEPLDIRAPVWPLKPGDEITKWVEVPLDQSWVEKPPLRIDGVASEAVGPLQFTLGKHVIRVAFPFYAGELGAGKKVRAVSDAVEIRVSGGGALVPVFSEAGRAPAFAADVYNDTDRTADLTPEVVLDGKIVSHPRQGEARAAVLPRQRRTVVVALASYLERPLTNGPHTLRVRIGGKPYGPIRFVWQDGPRTGPASR